MNGTVILATIVIVILAVIYGPLITIWALNTVFGLTIQMNLSTWFATLWLTAIVSAKAHYNYAGK